MERRLSVVVDNREKPSGIPTLLRRMGVFVRFKTLPVGDYIVSSECSVERKTDRDFLSSLFSGRLFDQAYRLSEAYRFPVLLVEGELTALIEESTNPRALWGALTTLAFGYGLSTFFTANTEQTADFIFTIAKRGRFSRPAEPFVKKPRAGSLQQRQLAIVSSLPNIGPTLAERMLRHFGTVRRTFSATAPEIALVRGLGHVRAGRIARILDAEYEVERGEHMQKMLTDG